MIMTLFQRKAIDWLKSLDNTCTPTDEGYYAQLILAMLDGLGEDSVSDLIERIDQLESKVEYLQDVLDDANISYMGRKYDTDILI